MKNQFSILFLLLFLAQIGIAADSIAFIESSNVGLLSATLLDPDTIHTEDTPIILHPEENSISSSYILVSSNILITDIKLLNLDLTHSFVGDISATLKSPSGTIVQLFDRPGVPSVGEFGCEDEDIFVSFDDMAVNTAVDFENTCEDSPAIGGVFQSIDPLSTFLGENAVGIWTLTIIDDIEDDGGSINDWQLAICGDPLPDYSLIPSEASYLSCTGDALTFSLQVGTDFDSPGVYFDATSTPLGSTFAFSPFIAMPGESVQFTIFGIDTPMDFTLQLTATDSNHITNIEIPISYINLANSSQLTVPTNEANNISLLPTFEWELSDNAENYRLQVADNIDFSNPIIFENTQGTSYVTSDMLDYNSIYFWRVLSENSCSSISSDIFSFTTEQNVAASNLPNEKWFISPNPSNGEIDIIFENQNHKELTIEVYQSNGKRLQQFFYENPSKNLSINLNYPNGSYIIRLISSKGSSTKSVLVLR